MSVSLHGRPRPRDAVTAPCSAAPCSAAAPYRKKSRVRAGGSACFTLFTLAAAGAGPGRKPGGNDRVLFISVGAEQERLLESTMAEFVVPDSPFDLAVAKPGRLCVRRVLDVESAAFDADAELGRLSERLLGCGAGEALFAAAFSASSIREDVASSERARASVCA